MPDFRVAGRQTDRTREDHLRNCDRSSDDLIIIGGGPAGLTAAVYAAILKMDTFLITKDLGGQAVDSTKIENYMGYDFITGPELVKRFQYQLIHSHYVDHLISDVEKIEPADDGFKVTVSELKDYSAKTLIVASGMTRRKLNVPGEEEFQRKGVFYGNIQDLSFVQGEDAKAAMSARQYMLKRKQKNSITGNNDEVEEEMIRQKIWNRAWNGYRKKNY
ncbi:MAG TPA: hypothetical protein ENG95_01055 [Nitrospirae bacterium]|nr:hypothetical protein [Nitrospirota bacterium]HDK17634.1 hypothetical protein [Nitrospirota bacterium]HDK81121.1 hypothetical protein [Nitrospirota bacterium]HDO25216.1 hypothetical protein [Nitrospirota bacterium]